MSSCQSIAAQDAAASPDESGPVLHAAQPALLAKSNAILRIARMRARHFPTDLLADDAMRLLLSLFVSEQQGIVLTERTLALANQLSREESSEIIQRLFHAGLVAISGNDTERRLVGLTPIGSARTRSFVDDHPDV